MRQIDTLRQFSTRFDTLVEEASRELQTRQVFEGTDGRTATASAERIAESVLRGSLEGTETIADRRARFALEAIILAKGRPPYLIVDDSILIDGAYDHVALIEDHRPELEALAKNVGRVDLVNDPTLPYAGTGWLIEPDVAVTNRHVVEVFTERDWRGEVQFGRNPFGDWIEARLDFDRQHRPPGAPPQAPPGRRAAIVEILYVAEPGSADIAFVKVNVLDGTEPLELATARADPELPVAAIGYPARDPDRNDPQLMDRLFKNIYDVKRFSPGQLTGHAAAGSVILGDYTSLGGFSGGAVVSLDTRKVVGLHYAGVYSSTNYAVAADIVASALRHARSRVPVGARFAPPPAGQEAPRSAATRFAGRRGYDPMFLGDGEMSVPLPELGDWESDVAPVSDDAGNILKYHHFSVIQSKSRRLPLLTAVNIDGARAFSMKRKGTWRLDDRLADAHQIGNALYYKNDLDRGHMVRRKDPGWGATGQEAQEAEIDTFHYTNSAPQHKDLNQKDWVGLEDYILESATTRGFKVTAFTGPVFRDDDRHLKEQEGAEDIPIPAAFWKVAVMVNDNTDRLSATGYVLTQGDLIRDMTEAAFVLGDYATYQVQIKRIEDMTGLDFGALKDADPLTAATESLFGASAFRILGAEDLRL